MPLFAGHCRRHDGAMVLKLNRTELLKLRGARGAAIEVLAGRVWITEQGRGADAFLAPGRRYRIWGDGLVLVSGEHALSEVSVRPG